jgi:hypothetical protein
VIQLVRILFSLKFAQFKIPSAGLCNDGLTLSTALRVSICGRDNLRVQLSCRASSQSIKSDILHAYIFNFAFNDELLSLRKLFLCLCHGIGLVIVSSDPWMLKGLGS